MRRLLRILIITATVLSLVLWAATMAAWVRSYQARDVVWWSWAYPKLEFGIGTCRGGLFAALYTGIGAETLVPKEWRKSEAVSYFAVGGSQGTFFNRFGFSWDRVQGSASGMRQFACPYWFIMMLTAMLPAARLAAWRRRARRLRMGPGLCRHCGYDCRATPERCPECGRVPAAAAVVATIDAA